MEKTGPSVTRFTMKELFFYGHNLRVRFGAAQIDEDVMWTYAEEEPLEIGRHF